MFTVVMTVAVASTVAAVYVSEAGVERVHAASGTLLVETAVAVGGTSEVPPPPSFVVGSTLPFSSLVPQSRR